VDDDPVVLLHAQTLLDSSSEGATGYIPADLRHPELAEFARYRSELNPDFAATLRDREQVTRLFEGLELVEPGVVQISKWRPDSELTARAAAALWGGVARKP
jgi:hypothetical protein